MFKMLWYHMVLKQCRIMHRRTQIAARQGRVNEACRLSERAHEPMSPGRPTHSSVIATRYQLGCICVQRGNDTEALRYFRDDLTNCQFKKSQKG